MGIDSITNPFQAGFSAQSSQTAATMAQGMFMGRVVSQIQTPESLLANAAEELSFAVDTTDDFELEERKERDKAIQSQAERVRMYQELMHEAGKGEKLNDLRDSLRTRSDSQRALDKAKEYFPDPTDAWAALLEARDELKQAGVDKAVLEDIDAALAELEQNEGAAIRAGMQGALAAGDF